MNLSRFGLTLALAACSLPAYAQVPAMAGAPSDRPLPPEPGQQAGTPGSLAGVDLPQADVLTLSEQRELGLVQQNLGTDLDRLDQEYADIETHSSTMDAETWGTVQQSRTAMRTRYSAVSQGDHNAFKTDREAMMRDYGVYNEALTRARLTMADERGYNQMVRDRMDWYGREIGRTSARMSDLPEGQRAEHAMEMIGLRRQHDALAVRHRRLGRAPVVERDALRRELTTDLARFDTSVRTSTMGWDWSAGGSTGN
jgi:cobyrinic acid a,c-diamide synthase